MKKIILISLSFMLFSINNILAQQVAKNYVVLEIATGTWCSGCPSAARGADALLEHGHQVAIIEHHNGDSYATSTSNGRLSYYNNEYLPTAYFNGGDEIVGSSGSSMYDSYLPKYNSAIAELSDFTLEMNYVRTGLDYEVTIDVNEVAAYAGTNLRIHLALIESHIPENWGGLTEVNFVDRAMYPNVNGTAYSGDATSLVLNFTADESWALENCELIAFVQDNATKEILQADKAFLGEPVGVNNAAIVNIEELETCDGLSSPIIEVKNYGENPITSFDLDYSANGGDSMTYNWSGTPMDAFDSVIIHLDEISYDLLDADNMINFEITQVNGGDDDTPVDNTGELPVSIAPMTADDYLRIHIVTNNQGYQCTWNVLDSSGAVVESGGPYANNTTIDEYLSLDANCYRFNLFDSGNNGGGTTVVVDSASQMLYYSGGNYGSGTSFEFSSPGATGVNEQAFQDSLIFPNPTSSQLNIINAEGLSVELFDVLGRSVYAKENIMAEEQINTTNLQEGAYILKLYNDTATRTEKVIILK